MDRSNGYESVAAEFLAGRGQPGTKGIGASTVRAWARGLAPGAAVLDLGCGSGSPMTQVLLETGLEVYAIDAAPTLVAAFRARFPGTPIACEPVEESTFFGRTFDAVLAWGLIFLLPADTQRELIPKVAAALVPGGRFIFTSPPEAITWNDAMTGVESRSLGAAQYRRLLAASGLTVEDEYEDAGENHYYDTIK